MPQPPAADDESAADADIAGDAAGLTTDPGAATESMNGIVMLIIGLSVGFIIGFLWGRFGKKLLKMLQEMLAKAASKAPEPDNGEADAIEDPDEGDEDDPEKLKEMLNTFLDSEMTPGIDDNPGIEFNPIFDYLIRRQKEQDRLEFAKKKAEEEGYEFDEGGDGPVAVGDGKQNALALLIAAGARVTSIRSANSAAEAAQKEARRKMKNIETFLAKVMDVDVSTTKREPGKRMTDKPILNVYEKAMDTAKNPPGARATGTALTAAQNSRKQLKSILLKRPDLNKAPKEDESSVVAAADDDAEAAAEEGEPKDEDDEGEEGEEGEYDDDDADDLAA